MQQESNSLEKPVSHKHLFTPGDWCMRPYCAQFGLTKEEVKTDPALESAIMDQYVRDCGFEPTDSWMMVVRPTGECEFTPLAGGTLHQCCEKDAEIIEELGPAIVDTPPYKRRDPAQNIPFDIRLQKLKKNALAIASGQGTKNPPFRNQFPNQFPNRWISSTPEGE